MNEATTRAHGAEGNRCPYCGTSTGPSTAVARCAVCGMDIGLDSFPHIILVRPGLEAVHFCSLSCMDNREFLEEGGDDG